MGFQVSERLTESLFLWGLKKTHRPSSGVLSPRVPVGGALPAGCRVIQCTAPSQRPPRRRCKAPADYTATEGGSGSAGLPSTVADCCVAAATRIQSDNSDPLLVAVEERNRRMESGSDYWVEW
ncbi:unnamed protein product [Urochloa humidicola]